MLVLLFIAVVFGYYGGIYSIQNTVKQGDIYMYESAKEKRMWKEKGYLKTPWGIKYGGWAMPVYTDWTFDLTNYNINLKGK